MCEARPVAAPAKKPAKPAKPAKPTKPPAPSLRALFRYATLGDALLLLLGGVALIVTSTFEPAQLLVFGQVADSFNVADPSAVKARISMLSGVYALLGLACMVTHATMTCCFAAVAARQAHRMRIAYFLSLIHI